jgi:hypothetical protein
VSLAYHALEPAQQQAFASAITTPPDEQVRV